MQRRPQVVDLGCLLDPPLIIVARRDVEQGRHGRVVVAVARAQVSASPDSPSFSSAYWRTVSSSRYRVRPIVFSATISDLSMRRVSRSNTW